jgi:molybdopterin/thiamine biosynthesis adenylyltransferase
MFGMPLVLVDRDIVESANLGTQGFTQEHLGLPKTEARARWLGPLNPSCRIEPLIHADIRRLGLGALRGCDILFSCLDSRTSRVAVNEIAMRLGIPWVDAGIDGSGRSMAVRVAAYHPRNSTCGCYICPHDSASFRKMLSAETEASSCSTKWWTAAAQVARPTVAASPLGGVAASVQAIWGMKILVGDIEEIAGKELHFDPDRGLVSLHQLKRNAHCLFDHRVYALQQLGKNASPMTIDETFTAAEMSLGPDVVLELPHRAIVTRLRCFDCGAEAKPYRMFESLGAGDALCGCGGEMTPVMTDILENFSRSQAAPFLHRTWKALGLPASDVVIATNGNAELHLLIC